MTDFDTRFPPRVSLGSNVPSWTARGSGLFSPHFLAVVTVTRTPFDACTTRRLLMAIPGRPSALDELSGGPTPTVPTARRLCLGGDDVGVETKEVVRVVGGLALLS